MRIDKDAFRRGVDDAMTLRPLWEMIHPNGDPEVEAVRRDKMKRTIRCCLVAIGIIGMEWAGIFIASHWR